MYLYLNRDGVIIDIVEEHKPVKKNRNGITVFCGNDDAEGYIGSDDQIYSKMGANLIPAYTDIAAIVMTDIPEDVKRLDYKYIDGEFVENEEAYPLDNTTLTKATAVNTANIDYIAAMSDIEL